ncbi:3338_t:CDS:2 [Diversispora eburnea]|uniref:3338_t:CDS:1 n=1 Tax=Diversispora eburnea TaxID=1213867 RepID=A0A9N9AR62_9GLOM|nr:3338_t:CDS:2 [Diversispora eburnea]
MVWNFFKQDWEYPLPNYKVALKEIKDSRYDIVRFLKELNIADENQRNTSKSQKQELFELFSHSSKLHPQSCYLGRYIYTLHGLHDLLEEIKSGKSSDPNIFNTLKLNESNESSTFKCQYL